VNQWNWNGLIREEKRTGKINKTPSALERQAASIRIVEMAFKGRHAGCAANLTLCGLVNTPTKTP
jgi:hypothetical protein